MRTRNAARNNLIKSRLRQTKQTNKRRRPAPVYNIGDKVMLSTRNLPLLTSHAKTAPLWIGPLKVINRRLETDNYTLQLPSEYKRIHPTFHVNLLKPYIKNNNAKFPSRRLMKPGPVPHIHNEERYEVEKILARRTTPRTGNIEYKVKWAGWGMNDSTWEPADHLEPRTIEEFENRTKTSIERKGRTNKWKATKPIPKRWNLRYKD